MPDTTHGSLTEDAYQRIRSEILSCRIRPGNKIVISDLCAELGFSLGAVREALSRLCADDLVTAEPRKGFTVTPVTNDELLDLTRVRSTIEILCFESAIRNAELKWETAIITTLFEMARIELMDPNDPSRVSDLWADAHRRFHDALVATCDSPWLLRLRETLYVQSERYRRISVPLNPSERDVQAEHKTIADHALARNSEAACAALAEHIERTTRILIDANVVTS